MAFIDEVLQQPSYGWKNNKGELIKPTVRQLFAEAFLRVNIFRDRKNWITLMSWVMGICMLPFLIAFFFRFFSMKLCVTLIFYSLIIMSIHSTIWYHRFCTHKAFTFSHPIWRFITQNIVIKTFPEELYVVSHHVHHAKSDLPGDPYNPQGGLLYCLLAEVNHQSISKNLSVQQYKKAVQFLIHTGVHINTYEQYLQWGSIASFFYSVILWVLNWTFWYGMFYLVAGHGLACALFSGAMLWMIGVRAFNYTSHGGGENKQKNTVDYDRRNLSLNQNRPGLFCGEWHNNHHLFPVSARAGFLPYQLDLSWIFIYSMYKFGVVSSYHDSKDQFLKKYKKVAKTRMPVK